MRTVLQPEKIRRLLVRGANWVGDAVMSLPALKRLRAAFPQTQISLLVAPWVSGVYEDIPIIDELLLYHRAGKHRGLSGRLRLIQTLQERQFDAAILLQNAFEAAALARLARIPIRAGYSRDGRGWLLTHPIKINPQVRRLHQTYYYLDLVNQLLGEPRTALMTGKPLPAVDIPAAIMPDMSLPVSAHRKNEALERLKTEGLDRGGKIVGVNPGAFFGSAKRWPSLHFATVLDGLIDQAQAQPIIFGSAKELPIAQSILSAMKHAPVVLAGKTRLSELIALISCCDLFLTNDSGPMHLAAALRVPTLAIFGSTDEISTGPLSPTARVINKKVECSPCLLRECPIDLRCMERISAEEVLEQALNMLAGGNQESHR